MERPYTSVCFRNMHLIIITLSSRCLMGCDAVWCCGRIPEFRMILLPSPSLHGVITHKTSTWNLTAVITSNLAWSLMLMKWVSLHWHNCSFKVTRPYIYHNLSTFCLCLWVMFLYRFAAPFVLLWQRWVGLHPRLFCVLEEVVELGMTAYRYIVPLNTFDRPKNGTPDCYTLPDSKPHPDGLTEVSPCFYGKSPIFLEHNCPLFQRHKCLVHSCDAYLSSSRKDRLKLILYLNIFS